MELRTYPLDPLGLHREADRGWVRALAAGPKTIQQVLAGASAAMDEQDRAEAYARDPIAYMRAERARRTLWGRLFGRR